MSVGFRRDEGQTFVEYALIISVIAIGMVLVLGVLSGQIGGLYAQIETDVNSVL